MTDHPHVPAAFINAIAEEGTKAEAVEWLQKTWNELCAVKAELATLKPVLPPRESHEACPDCADGRLLSASGGGVKCDRCSYWFCF